MSKIVNVGGKKNSKKTIQIYKKEMNLDPSNYLKMASKHILLTSKNLNLTSINIKFPSK